MLVVEVGNRKAIALDSVSSGKLTTDPLTSMRASKLYVVSLDDRIGHAWCHT